MALILPQFSFGADVTEQICLQIADSQNPCQGQDASVCRKTLESCADFFQKQSDLIAQDLTKTAAQKKTLSNQVSALKQKVSGLKAQIKHGNILIKCLAIQIDETKSSINKTSLQIQESKDQISNVLRAINEGDQKSSVEILLAGNLSDFFNNVVYLQGINDKLGQLLKHTQGLEVYLQSQKNKMDDEKTQTEKVVKVQTLQKQESEYTKTQQESTLKLTEVQYQEQLKQQQDVQKRAATIRARIFDILGVSQAPTFGQAYEIAKYAFSVTGIRPALLLAILTQESNLGKNVGQCYLKNPSTGDGVSIKTGAFSPKTMNPRDIPYFLQLITEINQSKGLDRNPYTTPVSCVMYQSGKPFGWGGAMGPGQFIASTWNKMGYGAKVSQVTGKTGDPWDIKDAFLAAGFYLKDSGGSTKSGEFNAVMRYFSGSSWSKWEEFYGRSVLSIAAGYEDDIAALSAGQ